MLEKYVSKGFLLLISNGSIGVNINSLTQIAVGFVINFCVVYLVKARNDLILSNPKQFEN